jgi:hypothetical protein
MKPDGKALAPGASEAESQKATAVFSESAMSPPELGGKKKQRVSESTTTVNLDGSEEVPVLKLKNLGYLAGPQKSSIDLAYIRGSGLSSGLNSSSAVVNKRV